MPCIHPSARAAPDLRGGAPGRMLSLRALARPGLLLGLSLLLPPLLSAAATPPRAFDVPAGDAAVTLKTFTAQAGEQILYSSHDVSGVPTHAIQGQFVPLAALKQMLAGTRLRARQDTASKAISVTANALAQAPPGLAASPTDDPTPPSPHPQAPSRMTPRNFVTLFAGWLLASSPALAQTSPAAGAPTKEDEVVVLSPFVISAGSETGYLAGETLAGMRLRTNLKDVGAAIDVLTEAFLDDVGAFDMNDALKYTANMQYADFPSASDPANNAQWFSASFISRGVVGNTVLTDFFPTGAVPIDRYNTDNLTMMRGPNAILFGIGSPAGIVGASTKRAQLNRNLTSIRFSTDQNRTARTELDVSRVLIKNRLAVRVAGLVSDKHTDQEPSLERRNAIYGSVTFKPLPSTSITASAEHGIRERIHVQNHITIDGYTPWVLAGKPMVTSRIGFPATGTAYNTGVGSGLQNMSGGSYLTYIEGSNLPIMDWRGMARGALWGNTVAAGAAGSGLILTADRSLMDNIGFTESTIPVPMNANVFGGLNRNNLRYESKSLFIEQNLWRDFDVELAWNEFESDYLFHTFAVGLNRILVDANVFMPDGRPNPYAGMPYLETGNDANGTRKTGSLERYTTRRATLSYRLDLDKHKIFRHIGLGNYRLGGLLQDAVRTQKLLATRIVNVTPIPNNPASAPLSQVANKLNRRYYLQPGDTGYRLLGPDTFTQAAVLGNTPANTGPLNFEERVSDEAPRNILEKTRSYVAAVQGSWWAAQDKDYFHLTGLYGWREDSRYNAAQTFVRNAAGEYAVPLIPARHYNGIEAAGTWGTPQQSVVHTKSYNLTYRPVSAVRLFYNYSDIFRTAAATFVDVFGNALRPAFGTTEDYGLKLDLWHERIFLTATKYETAVVDSTFDNSGSQRDPINNIYDAIGRPDLVLLRPQTYRDDTTTGYEFSLTANLTKGWNTRLTVGTQKTVVSAAFDDWVPYFEQNRPLWQQNAAVPLLFPAVGYTTVADAIARADQRLTDARSIIGQQPTDQRSYNSSLNTSYRFDTGRLAGFRIGAGYRWASSNVIGYVRDSSGNLDTSRPFEGPAQINTDLSFGYSRKFWKQKYTWDVQVNIYNVFDDQEIKSRQAVDNGKGEPVIVRTFLPDPRTFQLTNSIRF